MYFNNSKKRQLKHVVILIFLSQVTKQHMQFNTHDQLILAGKAAYVSYHLLRL